jgi:hypothetical protein
MSEVKGRISVFMGKIIKGQEARGKEFGEDCYSVKFSGKL